ncbi:DNA-binding protein WhiA [Pseudothermotoga thermarum]|uniref:Probable cell division protein WhiA n=1 Tax=Pseudothermotoga thermarum DSM 5069 TaxID=688269 RepID=F7YVH0_9THEM|nr:DNA-binding protein WhiA [Pseudothermotoga thermarum]AEH50481.1 protein of unknown function DUF199 [Pseudothermotoga thermarum DSM 5069]
MVNSRFSENVREELCSLEIQTQDQAWSEIIGYVKSKGFLLIKNEAKFVAIFFPSIKVSRRFFKLSKLLPSFEHETVVVQPKRLRKQRYVEVHLPLEWFTQNSPVDIFSETLPEKFCEDPFLFGSFLRGCYLSAGSVVDPRFGYHLELVCQTNTILKQVSEVLEKVFAIKSKVVQANNYYKLLIRRAVDLIEFLNLIGAVEAAAKLEQIFQKRLIASDVNRSMNFLSANADRISKSTIKQLNAIKIIEETIGLESIDEELSKLARLRMKNTELSLRELGELMQPRMTKSMVFNRMKKIMRIAEEIERGKES